jgi:thiamine pyrophosphokinase
MKKAFIYVGGEIHPESITEHPRADDLTIAADSGYRNALSLGDKVQILVGDFDSLDKNHEIDKSVEIVTVPTEKDFTDTQLAVETAIKHGARDIVIIGGLSGRLDHTLSNLAILRELCDAQIYGLITDGKNRVRYIRSTSTLISRSGYKYLSLIADGEKVKGVSLEGCKYPLENATLTDRYQYAVSNEITGNCALVSVKKGGLYIVESAD